LDVRCWLKPPPWGGLAGGGSSRSQVVIGGLAGGGSSHGQAISGGLAGGGSSHGQAISGGLAGGGSSHGQAISGGLAGGGSSHGQAISGGLAGGGSSHGQAISGGLAGGGSSHAQAISGGLAGGGSSHAQAISGGLAGGGSSHAQAISGGLAGGGSSTSSVKPPAFVQGADNNATGTTTVNVSVAWTNPTAAGNLLVALVANTGTFVSITPPAGWTLLAVINQHHWYYKQNAASQSSTGNFSYSLVGSGNLAVLVGEWTGIIASGALDKNPAVGTGFGSAPNAPVSGTLSQTNEVVICSFISSNVSAFSAPTNGFTIRRQKGVGTSYQIAMADKPVASTASTACAVSPTATFGWSADTATFKGF